MASIKEILLQVKGTSSDAVKALEEARAELLKFDGTDAQAVASLDLSKLDRQLADAEAKIDEVTRDRTVVMSARFETQSLQRARQEFSDWRKEIEHATQQPRTSGGLFAGFDRNKIVGDFAAVEREATSLGKDFDYMTRTGDQMPKLMDDMSLALSRVVPFLTGLAVVIGVSLVGAVIALAASLTAAIGGLGAIATGFAAAAGPAALIFLGIMTRLSKVMTAFQDREKSELAVKQQQIAASGANSNAKRAEQAAHQQLADALLNLTRAERDYQTALKEARQTLASYKQAALDAHHAVLISTRDEKDAETNLAKQTRDARRAQVDALERVKDAYLSLKDAQLSVEESENDLNKKQKTLNDLLNQLPSDKLGDVLKKLNDVNLDPGAVAAYIQTIAGPGSDPQLGQKIVDAQLAVARAKLAVSKANDKVHDSQVEVTRATQDYDQFLKHHLNAYGPYRQAVEQLHDASYRHAKALRDEKDATTKYQDALRAGIKQMPNVIAAHDRLIDAQRGVKRAQEGVTQAAKDAQRELKGAAASVAKWKAEYSQLSPAERAAANALLALEHIFKHLLGPTTNAFFKVFTSAVKGTGSLLGQLKGPLNTLGKAIVGVFKSVLKELGSARWKAFFVESINLATSLVKTLGPALRNLLNFFLAIASNTDVQATIRGMASGFAKFTGELVRMSKTKQFEDFIKLLVDSFKAWMGLARPLATIVIGFLKAAAPFGNELVKWITKALQKWGDWMNSKSGQDAIKQFFKDTIPLAKSILKLVVSLVTAFIKVFEAASPFLSGLIDGFSAALTGIAKVAGFIASLTNWGPIKWLLHALGLIASFFLGGSLLGKVGAFFGKFVKALDDIIPAVLKFFGKFGISVVNGLGNALLDVARWIDSLGAFIIKGAGTIGKAVFGVFYVIGSNLVGAIVDGAKAVWHFITDLAGWLWDRFSRAFKGLISTIKNVGGWLVSQIVAGVKAVASFVEDAAKWWWKTYSDFWLSIAGDIVAAGTWVVTKIVDGVKAAASAVADVAKTVAGWIGDGVKAAIDFGADILKAIASSIVSAAGAVASAGGAIASWLANGLGALAGWGKQILDAIAGAIKGAVKTVGSVGGSIADWIVNGIRSGIDFGAKILNWIANAVKSAAGKVASIGGKVVGWIWEGIKGAASIGGKILRQLESWIVSAIKGGANVGRKILGWIWDGMKAAGGLAGRVAGALFNAGGKLLDVGKHWAQSLWNGLTWVFSKIEDAINSVTDLVTGGHLKGQVVHKDGKGHWVTKDGVVVGTYAEGGIATRATLGVFGEEPGVSEAVIPLKDAVLAKIGQAIVGSLARSTGSISARLSGDVGVSGAGDSRIEQTFVVEAPSTGGQPDMRAAAALLAHEARTRGGFTKAA